MVLTRALECHSSCTLFAAIQSAPWGSPLRALQINLLLKGDDLRSWCLSQRTTSYSIPFCHVPRSLLLELAFLGEHLFTGQI